MQQMHRASIHRVYWLPYIDMKNVQENMKKNYSLKREGKGAYRYRLISTSFVTGLYQV